MNPQSHRINSELVRAMLGNIADHFRSVSWDFQDDQYVFYFVISELDGETQECVDDIIAEFSALQPTYKKIIAKIHCTSGTIFPGLILGVLVYLKRDPDIW